jgi:hypothetical protein
MREIFSDRCWYIRTEFAYTANFVKISEIGLDTQELGDIPDVEEKR